MTSQFPLQIIAVDEAAHQALDVAELKHFEEISKIDISKLSSTLIENMHPIILFSKFDTTIVQTFIEGIEGALDPIVVVPKSFKETEAVKRMVLNGMRILFFETDTIVAISLAKTLKMLEKLFYGSSSDEDIVLEHSDIYESIVPGTFSSFYTAEGNNLDAMTLSALNVPESFSNVVGIVVIYDIQEDQSLMEVAQSMDIIETKMDEESVILFETRNTMRQKDHCEVTCLITRRYDFVTSVQKKIKASESYLSKVSILVNTFYEGEITGDETEMLAIKNHLDMKDLDRYYELAYAQPKETVRMIESLKNEKFTDIQKEETVADAVVYERVNLDIIEALIEPFGLSVESILEMVDLKREGKLFLFDNEISVSLKKQYPDIIFSKSGERPVLVKNEEVEVLENGMKILDAAMLADYEKDNKIWLVSKKFSTDEIEILLKEYEA